MIAKWRPKVAEPIPLDLVRAGRIVAIAHSWDGLVAELADAKAGVHEVQRNDGTVVAVATVRADGTWRIEGGKRHGR